MANGTKAVAQSIPASNDASRTEERRIGAARAVDLCFSFRSIKIKLTLFYFIDVSGLFDTHLGLVPGGPQPEPLALRAHLSIHSAAMGRHQISSLCLFLFNFVLLALERKDRALCSHSGCH